MYEKTCVNYARASRFRDASHYAIVQLHTYTVRERHRLMGQLAKVNPNVDVVPIFPSSVRTLGTDQTLPWASMVHTCTAGFFCPDFASLHALVTAVTKEDMTCTLLGMVDASSLCKGHKVKRLESPTPLDHSVLSEMTTVATQLVYILEGNLPGILNLVTHHAQVEHGDAQQTKGE